MKAQLISQIIPLIITFIVGIIAVVIKAVGNAIVTFVNAKQEEVVKRIGQAKYQDDLGIARSVWLIVEEHFRINKIVQNVTSEKIELFNKLLLEKIPYLEQKDIDFLRQTIAGEVNQFKLYGSCGNNPVPALTEDTQNTSDTSASETGDTSTDDKTVNSVTQPI